MLTCDSLRYQMAGNRILDDCSLTIDDRSIVSLLGPSGSGKTSILRAIMGLATPQQGSATFLGTTLFQAGRNLVPANQRPFAFLFQHFTLLPHLNVKRNILIGIRELPKAERKARLEELCDLLQIGDLVDRSIHDLSGGEQQRVALARTLAIRPRLLLLDEPFSNLDKMTRFQLYHDIKALIRDGDMAAILATHDQEEAFFFSDRMVVMNEGRVVADDTPHAIYDAPTSEWLARFTGEAHIISGDDLRRSLPDHGLDDVLGNCRYLIRPEHLAVSTAAAGGRFTVTAVDYYGSHSMIALRDDHGLRLSAAGRGAQRLAAGERVAVSLTTPPMRLQA